jgi:hypothetical protein
LTLLKKKFSGQWVLDLSRGTALYEKEASMWKPGLIITVLA